MKKRTQLHLALLVVGGVALVGDLMLRELPEKILARLAQPAAHRATARLPLAEIFFGPAR